MQDPQSLHKYLYVHGDPIMMTDPTGMFGLGGISVGMSIAINMNVTTLTQGAVTALALSTIGSAGMQLRNTGLLLLAAGEIDAGIHLYELGGKIFGAGAQLIETANNGIEFLGAAVGILDLTRAGIGFVRSGGLRRISGGLQRMIAPLKRLLARSSDAAMAVRGSLRGWVASADYVEAYRQSVAQIRKAADGRPMTITLEVHPRGTIFHSDGRPARALYSAEYVNGQHRGVLKIPHDATYYEIQHELQHMFHHMDEGRRYFRLTEEAAELHVYEKLRESPFWSTFTKEEKLDALYQTGQRRP